jgi:ABC-type transporter Mla subunit MlaD
MTERPNPLERLLGTQRAALRAFTERLEALAGTMAPTGFTAPDEALRQLAAAIRAAGDLAASTARPMEMFLETQRQLATTMRSYAELQRQLADVLAVLAENQAAVVDALESLSNPVLGIAESLRSRRPSLPDEEQETDPPVG